MGFSYLVRLFILVVLGVTVVPGGSFYYSRLVVCPTRAGEFNNAVVFS